MVGKLRPVGSRVPSPRHQTRPVFPWEAFYQTQFMGSGTQALSVAIALSIQRRSGVPSPEVIVPAYGCPDLIAAIVAQGATPVLVDLEPDSAFMNIVSVREAISSSTVSIVGVGFLGISERIKLLAGICRENDLFLIEDSAQCFPPASSLQPLADCVVLSFGRGKPINLMGGGALLFRKQFAEEAELLLSRYPLEIRKTGIAWWSKRLLINFLLGRVPYKILERLPLGIGETRFHQLLSISRERVPENLLSAGIHDLQSRPEINLIYDAALPELKEFGWKGLKKTSDCDRPHGWPHLLLRYPILAPSREIRDRAILMLNSAGIGANAFYGKILADIDGVDKQVMKGSYPTAADFAARLLTLPTHEDVEVSDVGVVKNILIMAARQGEPYFKRDPA